MKTGLEGVGYYISGRGGAPYPARIEKGKILFEMITEGAVYAPDGGSLHGVGAVFVHREGQETVSRTEGEGYYACLTARFYVKSGFSPVDWMRYFVWDDVKGVLRFSEEMLYAYHHTEMNRRVIGELIWSQFQYRMHHSRGHQKERGIPSRLAAVLGHMEKHYGESITIEDLAARIGLSASQLHAEFREHLGATPHQHLIHQRMQAARHKLACSNDPVKAVAHEVGYANTENFCRAFKKYSGLTAASYRDKYRTYRGVVRD